MASPKAYVLDLQAANWVYDQSRKFIGATVPPELIQHEPSPKHVIQLLNNSGETIPAFGIVEVQSDGSAGVAQDNQFKRPIVKAIKPSNKIANFLVNSGTPIPPLGIGTAQMTDPFCIVASDNLGSFANPVGVLGFKIATRPSGQPLLDIRPLLPYTIEGTGTPSTIDKYLCIIKPLDQILFQAPVGGIPGRVGTLSQDRICTVFINRSDTYQLEASTTTAVVFNWKKNTVCANGNRFGIAARVNSVWQVVEVDPDDTGSNPNPNPTVSSFADVPNPIIPDDPFTFDGGSSFNSVRFQQTGVGTGNI